MITRSRILLGFAALFAFSAAACQKVPLLAPTGSTITLTASTNVLPVNGSTDLIAQVVESAGTAPHSGTVVNFTTTLGTIQPSQPETDASGMARATFTAGASSGTATITANSGTATTGTAGAVKILIGTAGVGRVVVSANPTLVPAFGGTSLITANVFDVNGNVLPSAPVAFTTDHGTLSVSVVPTDPAGVAKTVLTTSVKATVTANVGAQGTTTTPPPSSGGTTPTTPSASGQASGQVVVDIAASPTLVIKPPSTTPTAGLPSAFTFTISIPSGATNVGAVRDLTINWGDGSPSQDVGAVQAGDSVQAHVYRTQGTYTITATLIDTAGNTIIQSASVVVIPVSRPTIIIQFSDGTFAHPADVTFNIQITVPTGIGIQDVTINFGDGTINDVGGATGSLPPIHHTYLTGPQSYPVSVSVTDSIGNVTTGTTVVTIT